MTYIIIFPRLESFIAENEIVKLPPELAKNKQALWTDFKEYFPEN